MRVLLALACATLGMAVAGVGSAQPADDALIGLWSGAVDGPPALQGGLTVARRGPVWRAAIGKRHAEARVTGHEVRLSFAGHLGQYRGRLAPGGREIVGFWVQPAGTSGGGAPDTGQAYASPLTLHAVGPGVWRGQVRPLGDRFTLYLRIFRGEDGSLVAAFRNPELNAIGGRTQYLVTRSGEAVRFASRPAPGQAEVVHTALLQRAERLRIRWPGPPWPIDLVRRPPGEAAAFFPRPPGAARYVYRPPPARADGWDTARAADVGLDEAALAQIVQGQIDADPTARRPSLMHSILVARHGKLVLEEYFFGFDRDTPHDTRSAAKTFASVMLGARMRTDPGFGPDSRAYEVLADRGPFAHPDPRKAQITLAHLLTHTSGLACDDNDPASPGGEERMQAQAEQPDWWRFTLDQPMAHDPGRRYAYCSAGINLVGAALTARTGTWLPELFERTVARPLQFGPYYWNLMPNGEGYQGGGAVVLPRDLLKLGQAYLDGGVWRGRRIVDAGWVALSTAPQAEITPETTGLDADHFAESYNRGADGYAWHLNTLRVGDRSYREYEATGNGGQVVAVVPDLDLVVGFTAGNYQQGGVWGRWRDQIIGQRIAPAIR